MNKDFTDWQGKTEEQVRSSLKIIVFALVMSILCLIAAIIATLTK